MSKFLYKLLAHNVLQETLRINFIKSHIVMLFQSDLYYSLGFLVGPFSAALVLDQPVSMVSANIKHEPSHEKTNNLGF